MNDATAAQPLNVFGEPLADCSHDPLTGFFRDGCCRSDARDGASHTVCARVTEAFLQFSKTRGNDLGTPRPEYGFAGLKPGDQWCLCAARWYEAYRADPALAPPVRLAATDRGALQTVPLEALKRHALDLS